LPNCAESTWRTAEHFHPVKTFERAQAAIGAAFG
jgi:hypothetical protein